MHFDKLSMNPDTLFKVFETALSQKRTTRTNLADLCSLSAMTTGRAADFLVENDVLRQSNTVDSSYKRRSKVLFVKQKYFIGIYTIAPEGLFFHLCDLSLKPVYSFNRSLGDSIFIDETVNDFLKSAVSFANSKINTNNLCAIGVLVSGEYDKEKDAVINSPIPHFAALRIANIFSNYSFGKPVYISSLYSTFAESIKEDLSDSDAVLSLIMSRSYLATAYISHSDSRCAAYKNISRLSGRNGRPFSSKIQFAPDPDPFLDDIADIILTITASLPCSGICISGGLYTSLFAVIGVISEKLKPKYERIEATAPNLFEKNLIDNAVKQCSKSIRKQWFYNNLIK